MYSLGVATILALPLLLSSPGSARPPPEEQSPVLSLLNQDGVAVTRLTDGDLVRLRVSSLAGRSGLVSFQLDADGPTVAQCQVEVGAGTCQADPIPAFGWYWAPAGQARPIRELRARQDPSHLLATLSVQVAPRPVVFVHGFISGAAAWQTYLGPYGYLATVGIPAYAVGDGQEPGVLSTGNIVYPTERTNTIAENAQVLAGYIAGVEKATGVQQVDLVGHSMGGLISRYYIDRLMTTRNVAQLIMLGTPQAGTDCANLPAALGFYLPATLEIRPSYVRDIFDRQIVHQRGVPFYVLAGTPIVDPIQSPCTGVPSDLAVARDSALDVAAQASQLPILHIDLNASREVFDGFVRPILEKPAGESFAEPDRAAPGSAAGTLQFTRVMTGQIAAGASQDFTVLLDHVAVASFALFDPTHSLTVTVRGASGNVIQLDPAKNGLMVVDDPATLVYLGYGFHNPKPGAWHITVRTTSKTPAQGATFALTAQVSGGPSLNASANVLLPQLDQPVELSASLADGASTIPLSEATATIRQAEGKTLTLDMGGDTARRTLTWRPSQPGLHGITIVAHGLSPDGLAIERSAFLSVEVQPSAPQSRLGQVAGLALIALPVVGLILAGVWLLRRTVFRHSI